MLAAKYRLRRDEDIKAVVQKGYYAKFNGVNIALLKTNQDSSRVACVAGKKVSKSAVQRHLVQRRLRSIAKDILGKYPSLPSFDMVWLALPGLSKKSDWASLSKSINDYFAKTSQ